jgi:hypothetical protein
MLIPVRRGGGGKRGKKGRKLGMGALLGGGSSSYRKIDTRL